MDRIEIVGLWKIFINTTGKWEHYKFSFMDRNRQKKKSVVTKSPQLAYTVQVCLYVDSSLKGRESQFLFKFKKIYKPSRIHSKHS